MMTCLMDLFIQPLRKVLLTPLLRMHLVALRARKSGLRKLELEHKSLIQLYHLHQEQVVELEIREMELMLQVESLESSMKKFTRGEHKHK
jgi:hypothetical protein